MSIWCETNVLDIYADIWRRSKLTAHEIGLCSVVRVRCLLMLPLLFVACPFISWLYPLLATYSIAIFYVVCVGFYFRSARHPHFDRPYCIYSTFSALVDRCLGRIAENKNDRRTGVKVYRKKSIYFSAIIIDKNGSMCWLGCCCFFLTEREKGYTWRMHKRSFLIRFRLCCAKWKWIVGYGATAVQPCSIHTMLYSIGVASLVQAVACERNIL